MGWGGFFSLSSRYSNSNRRIPKKSFMHPFVGPHNGRRWVKTKDRFKKSAIESAKVNVV